MKETKEKRIFVKNLMGYDDIICEFALCTFNLLDRVAIEPVAQRCLKKVLSEEIFRKIQRKMPVPVSLFLIKLQGCSFVKK